VRALPGLDARKVQRLCHRKVSVHPTDVSARHHQRRQGPLVQAKHVLHHLAFMVFDQAGVQAFIEAGRDFFFSDSVVGLRVDAQQLEHALCGGGQQSHER
jgi:hypothetical protein